MQRQWGSEDRRPAAGESAAATGSVPAAKTEMRHKQKSLTIRKKQFATLGYLLTQVGVGAVSLVDGMMTKRVHLLLSLLQIVQQQL